MGKWLISIAIVFAVAWFAFPQTRASFIALAPFAIILICPLMMLFGMHGHGKHGEGASDHKEHSGCCDGEAHGNNATAKGGHGDGHTS